MLRCRKTSDAEIPPRTIIPWLVAIRDGRWEAGIGGKRCHSTSPKDGANNIRAGAMREKIFTRAG